MIHRLFRAQIDIKRVLPALSVLEVEKSSCGQRVCTPESWVAKQDALLLVGAGGPVYLAAVLDYLTTEIVELAGDAACDNKTRIIPRYLQLAIRNEELNNLLGKVTIARARLCAAKPVGTSDQRRLITFKPRLLVLSLACPSIRKELSKDYNGEVL
ncbi:core histone macro-H2A.1-like [Molossus molossus]|uniref:core histone macro-H2A.1-like n=1 Tax=Molossus molossus TaxID=27622 RepID=UPI0017476938|nr:core histone macro-H2A.1-like [Molossus molossus]